MGLVKRALSTPDLPPISRNDDRVVLENRLENRSDGVWREARGEEVGGEENDNNNKKKKKDILPTRRGRILKMPRTAGQGGRKSERGQMGSPCIEARRGATCEEARMYVNMGRRWEKDGESHGN